MYATIRTKYIEHHCITLNQLWWLKIQLATKFVWLSSPKNHWCHRIWHIGVTSDIMIWHKLYLWHQDLTSIYCVTSWSAASVSHVTSGPDINVLHMWHQNLQHQCHMWHQDLTSASCVGHLKQMLQWHPGSTLSVRTRDQYSVTCEIYITTPPVLHVMPLQGP